MGQEVAHGDARLPRLRELGAAARDGRVQIELAGLDQAEEADRAECLAHGEEVDDRVAGPRARAGGVGVARPEVEDALLVDVDG